MAAKSTIKRILQVLENWPLDQNKAGRDLGQYLRESLQIHYKEGKLENAQYWDRQYLALQKIINNEHKKKYPRLLSSSATGLTVEQCNLALSNEVLEQLKEEEQSLYHRYFTKKKNVEDN